MTDYYNPFSLVDKTILITGASSGIGRAITVECTKMGAIVIAVGRNQSRLEETKSMCKQGNCSLYTCDITKKKEIEQLILSIPPLDGVVHCAGIGQRILCKQLREIDIDNILDINFKATVLLQTGLLTEKRIKKGASIVFVSSMASWSPSIGNSIYSASKGAISSFASCLSLELAPRQIRVNCISPAMVLTKLILQDGLDEEILKQDEKKYPLGRYGSPNDIAYLAIYLLSDTSRWMTGSNIKISGGAK